MQDKIKLKQHTKTLTSREADRLSQLIIVIPKAQVKGRWPVFVYADILKKRLSAADIEELTSTPYVTHLPNPLGTHVVLGAVSAEMTSFELLTLARKLAGSVLARQPGRITLCLAGLTAPALLDLLAGVAV